MINDVDNKPELIWPDGASVFRQYVVVDDSGRYGIAIADTHRHPGVLFAYPVEVDKLIVTEDANYMTYTPWHSQDNNTYIGVWYDSSDKNQITIVSCLGYVLPDRYAHATATILIGSNIPKIHPNEMSIGQAVSYAQEDGKQVPARTIRYAASHGYIPGARKLGRDWLIPYEGFNHYLDNRPKPGR